MYSVSEIIFKPEDLEQLGTKEKFWFRFDNGIENRHLFKFSRENTGEHWSEKIASEICELLEIPHVKYELARYGGRPGIFCENVVPDYCRLVMGNEVLHSHSPNEYPRPEGKVEKFVRVREHTINRVLGCLEKASVLPPVTTFDLRNLNAGDVFAGYLLLDALVSNQDRHHENWGIITDGASGSQYLSPTYDHAASLGRELLDEERAERLSTRDANRTVKAFVGKAKSEFFRMKTDRKPLLTIDAFYEAVEKRSVAKKHWLMKLNALEENMIVNICESVPSELISSEAVDFAVKMVLENKRRLLNDSRA